MFENFERIHKNYVPNNIIEPTFKTTNDSLVIGATNEFVFEIPVELDDIADAEFIYKAGITTFIKTGDDITATANGPMTFISSILTPEETKDVNPYLDFKVQTKIELIDGSIMYSKTNKVKVVKTLDN